jgi:hypothetical protein
MKSRYDNAEKHAKFYHLMEQIARYRCLGNRDTTIARLLNLTNSGLQRILRLDEYRDIEKACFSGQLSAMDEELASNVRAMHRKAAPAVPAAHRRIIEIMMQQRDLRAALGAAKEILDRDPERVFLKQETSPVASVASGLPASLVEAISRDADGVSNAVASKLKHIDKVDA